MRINKKFSAATPPSYWAWRTSINSAVQPAVNASKVTRMAKQLNPGDTFPTFKVNLTDGGTLNLPADLKAEYAVIIYYRGIW